MRFAAELNEALHAVDSAIERLNRMVIAMRQSHQIKAIFDGRYHFFSSSVFTQWLVRIFKIASAHQWRCAMTALLLGESAKSSSALVGFDLERAHSLLPRTAKTKTNLPWQPYPNTFQNPIPILVMTYKEAHTHE